MLAPASANFSPLSFPVATAMLRAPAALAACTSRTVSPMTTVACPANQPPNLAAARLRAMSGSFARASASEPVAAMSRSRKRDTETVLEQARGLLDFSQLVAVLMFAVLHFLPDEDDPAAVVDAYWRAIVPGSLLALTHATDDFQLERLRDIEDVYRSASAGLTGRSHAQITALLGGYDWSRRAWSV